MNWTIHLNLYALITSECLEQSRILDSETVDFEVSVSTFLDFG